MTSSNCDLCGRDIEGPTQSLITVMFQAGPNARAEVVQQNFTWKLDVCTSCKIDVSITGLDRGGHAEGRDMHRLARRIQN